MTSYTTQSTSLQSIGCPHCGAVSGAASTEGGPIGPPGQANSITPLSALFFPAHDNPSPCEIPETTIGIVDTIRWRLDLRRLRLARYGRALHADLDDLTRKRDWFRLPVRDHHRLREVARYHRARDGARIILYESSVQAEVSAPRHAGYSNDEVHRLSEHDVMAFLRELEYSLLRRTTAACRTRRVQQEWHLCRIDLAIDFPADMREIIETYRDSRHPRIRGLPEVYRRNGIAWIGKRYQLTIYETDKRPKRSKLRSVLGERAVQTTRPGFVRAEFRFRGREAVRVLASLLPDLRHLTTGALAQALPYDRGGVTGRADVAWTRMTNGALHRVLAIELSALDGAVRPMPPACSKNVLHGYGLIFVAGHPQTWSVIEDNYSERGARVIEQQLTQLRVRTSKTRLVELAWRTPRFLKRFRPRVARHTRHRVR